MYGTVKYRFNNHCHTSVSDGELSPKNIADLLKGHPSLVLSVTDHLRIGAYDTLGDHPQIVPGIEVKVSEGNVDFLIHTETPGELENFYREVIEPANPSKTMFGPIDMDAEHLLSEVEERGHTAVLAHYWAPEGLSALPPDRQRFLAKRFRPFVEYNGRMGRARNAEARRFARKLHLPMVAGADSHLHDQHTDTFTSVRLPEGTPPTMRNLFEEIRKRKVQFRLRNAGWVDTMRTVWKATKSVVQRFDGFNGLLHAIKTKNQRLDY